MDEAHRDSPSIPKSGFFLHLVWVISKAVRDKKEPRLKISDLDSSACSLIHLGKSLHFILLISKTEMMMSIPPLFTQFTKCFHISSLLIRVMSLSGRPCAIYPTKKLSLRAVSSAVMLTSGKAKADLKSSDLPCLSRSTVKSKDFVQGVIMQN